ncbi:bacteriocin [Methyloraptor flagellatus]|uniref:Bacteriocin n=1 Tax=Methyloraptor flagellatus TaxID=3162530 RepID=A0AAU7X7D5_9HYPH
MRTKVLLPVIAALSLGACSAYNQTDRAIVGGAIGAGTGAAIGAATGGGVGAAVAGGVIGGAGGAMIGAATTPRYHGRCYARNEYGERVRVPCN